MGLLDKVKEAATKAGEQIQHGIDSGKEQLEAAKLHKQITELLGEIGGLVLHQRRGDAPDDADAQIDAKIARIGELEAELAAEAESPSTPADGEAPTGDGA